MARYWRRARFFHQAHHQAILTVSLDDVRRYFSLIEYLRRTMMM